MSQENEDVVDGAVLKMKTVYGARAAGTKRAAEADADGDDHDQDEIGGDAPDEDDAAAETTTTADADVAVSSSSSAKKPASGEKRKPSVRDRVLQYIKDQMPSAELGSFDGARWYKLDDLFKVIADDTRYLLLTHAGPVWILRTVKELENGKTRVAKGYSVSADSEEFSTTLVKALEKMTAREKTYERKTAAVDMYFDEIRENMAMLKDDGGYGEVDASNTASKGTAAQIERMGLAAYKETGEVDQAASLVTATKAKKLKRSVPAAPPAPPVVDAKKPGVVVAKPSVASAAATNGVAGPDVDVSHVQGLFASIRAHVDELHIHFLLQQAQHK